VVRGVAGRRSEYRPVQSSIAKSASPRDVAEALARQFGFQTAYVADLDAIAGGEPAWQSYDHIAAAGLALWLDAGLGDVPRAQRLLEFLEARGGIERLVIGLESLATPRVLTDLVAACGAERMVFSLDLKAGVPLTTADAWRELSPEQIAATAVECGINSLILLDLAHVGTYQGSGTEELCRALRLRYPHVQLIGGGGVRSMEDMRRLFEAGFDFVLVASALHDGRIRPQDLVA
jgi:phosphoribosylformimino-5-aminoimidazole carboxamide ribotide isomerase